MRRLLLLTLLIGAVAFPGLTSEGPLGRVRAQSALAASPLDLLTGGLSFRNVGPFRTSSWVTEIAVPETPVRDRLYTIYAATRSGGLWKTSNNGITWDPIRTAWRLAPSARSRLRCPIPMSCGWGRARTTSPDRRTTVKASSSPPTPGAQILWRSKDRGDTWEEISPDLTTNDPEKIGRNVPYATITTISESPVAAGAIWVGTDNGKVQVTRDAGGGWTDATAALVAAGAPVDRYVSRVFASPHEAGTAFVAKSGFRNDDFRPFLYRTNDFGATWTSIGRGLPDAPINVVVQDRRNADLLIVGNDLGVWVSIDAGANWSRLKANLPTVPVHDLTVHPRENDLVLGTYGRGIWIGDITPLQQTRPAIFTTAAHAFDIEPRARYGFGAIGNYNLFGSKYIRVPNEPDALVINYFLREKSSAPAKVTVADASGKVLSELTGPAEAGLNRVLWGMRPGSGPPGRRGGGGGAAGGGGPGRGGAQAGPVPPGDYQIRIDVAGQTFTKTGTIRPRIGD